MIQDHDRLSLEVRADKSVVNSDTSVSLGLIVTELVINALKHAFPNNRRGKIIVDYRADGSEWTLSVGDNGVGMPENSENAKPGLGTGIVQALARQLLAHIKVTNANPGTAVSITHIPVAAADGEAKVIPLVKAV
jgi:two-component sensor histidine kinase